MNNIDQIKISKTHTLKEALEILDRSAMSILLLVDSEGVLQRTITDGDIRRQLLAGKGLSDTFEQLEPIQSLVVKEGMSRSDIVGLMNKHGVTQIPVVNAKNKPVGLHLSRDMMPRIELSMPHMGGYERQYVEEAFETNWIAPLGPNVDAFESDLAEYVGSGSAAAVNSGTAAIHLALRLLDVSTDDIVLCSSLTFIGSANPILYQGATPVFVDSEPATWNMSPQALERALKESCEKGQKPKAIIVVHLYGQSADMKRIMELSEQYDVPVIEDAAESLGALYQGKHTGTIGKIGIFSFNGNKIITTSGGGMVISDDHKLVERCRYLSTQARKPAPHYEHTEMGYNYRMSNVLAGIGRGQLMVLDSRVETRRDIFERYRDGLSDLDCFEWMPEPEGDYSNRWLSAAILNSEKTDVKPQDLIKVLAEVNIDARHFWKPMHQQALFDGCSYYKHDDNSFCDYLFATGICLPSASNMTGEQQDSVISIIRGLLS